MPLPDIIRKRPKDGGADNARSRKRTSQGVIAPSPNSAFTEKLDPPALISLADGSRRYNEFKGDIDM